MLPADITLPRVSHTLPPHRTFAPIPKPKEFDVVGAMAALWADPACRALWADPPNWQPAKKAPKAKLGEDATDCPQCGKQFTIMFTWQKYCTEGCKMQAKALMERERSKVRAAKRQAAKEATRATP